jgi:hypothetical protein
MIEVIRTPKSNFEKFFVFEADGKKPARVTKVTPNTEEDENDYTQDPDNQNSDTDTPEDNQDSTNDETDDAMNDLDNLTNDNPEDDNNDSDSDNNSGNSENENDAMNDLDQLTGDDQEDDDTDNSDSGEEDNTTDGEENQVDQAPEQNNDAFKKYSLYRDLVSLYNTVNAYIGKLESILKDNIEANLVIKTVTAKLRDVEDLMYDYMTIKFQSDTYIQALIFFESIIAIIGLNFKMLKNNQIYLKQ